MRKGIVDRSSMFSVAHVSEELYFRPDGKWMLRFEGNRHYQKALTSKKAEEWLKENYPSWPWGKCLKECEEWRSSKKVGVLPLK